MHNNFITASSNPTTTTTTTNNNNNNNNTSIITTNTNTSNNKASTNASTTISTVSPDHHYQHQYHNKQNIDNVSAASFAVAKPQPEGMSAAAAQQQQSQQQAPQLYDCVAYIFHCVQHDKVALSAEPLRNHKWLPFAPLPPRFGWHAGAIQASFLTIAAGDQARAAALRAQTESQFSPYTAASIVEIARIQIPQNQKFFIRILFALQIDMRKRKQFAGQPQQQQQQQQQPNQGQNNNNNKICETCRHDFDHCGCCCCQWASARIEWRPSNMFGNGGGGGGNLGLLWGPEPIDFVRRIVRGSLHSAPQRVSEITLASVYRILIDSPAAKLTTTTQTTTKTGKLENCCNSPNNSSTAAQSPEREMLAGARVTQSDLECVYADFIEHCFPALAMTACSFAEYMRSRSLERDEIRLLRLFRAFNIAKSGYLTFRELLLGLAAIDPYTPHSIARIGFVFRYYARATAAPDTMHEPEYRRMVRDMNPALIAAINAQIAENHKRDHKFVQPPHPSLSNNNLDAVTAAFEAKIAEFEQACNVRFDLPVTTANAAAAAAAAAVPGTQSPAIASKMITYDAFIQAVLTHRVRGTAALCRAKRSAFAVLIRASLDRQITAQRRRTRANRATAIVSRKSYSPICERCKVERRFRLSPFLGTLVAGDGRFRGPPWPPLANGYVRESSAKIVAVDQIFADDQDIPLRVLAEIHRFAETMLAMPDKGTRSNPPKGVGSRSPEMVVSWITALTRRMLPLLDTSNGKVAIVSSPCFIIGDIHGNLEDLLTLERHLFSRMPIGANVLFLGDYVDRGWWGVECALMIIAARVAFPDKITALRGNHEVRDLQRKYTFLEECQSKYGRVCGETIFERLNQMFDRFPIAAIVDDAIYAAHGGIPRQAATIAEIASLPLDMRNEKDSEVFWEIVWSDPIASPHFEQLCELFRMPPNEQAGFVRNTRRGTAWYFSEAAANAFFTKNGLTHIVRAHEVPDNGFTFHFGDKCATIFSSSHYQNNNKCAVIFASQEVLRVIVIDTSDNRSPFLPPDC